MKHITLITKLRPIARPTNA